MIHANDFQPLKQSSQASCKMCVFSHGCSFFLLLLARIGQALHRGGYFRFLYTS